MANREQGKLARKGEPVPQPIITYKPSQRKAV